jgi:hypothetical protein
MGKNKDKNNRNDKVAAPPAGNRGVSIAMVGLLAVAIVAALGVWWWATNRTNKSAETPPAVETRATTTPSVAAAPKADFQKLKGKWLRPDGGYVVEVKTVEDSGRMDASYFNPGPIHVAKAEASQDGASTKVFIELRDVNYPGSTYDLVYDPQTDSLQGIYYQAALQQRFEVVFTRMK